jgi:pyruvate dehydrogenase E1 component alpha subunit
MFDPELYRDKREVEDWKQRDPIATFTHWLRDKGYLDDTALTAIEDRVAAEIAAAVEFAEAGSWEPVAELTRDVYTPRQPA